WAGAGVAGAAEAADVTMRENPEPADITRGEDAAEAGRGGQQGSDSANQMDLDPARPPQPVHTTTPPHRVTPHHAIQDPTSLHPAPPDHVAPDQVTQDPVGTHPATPDQGAPDQVRQTPVAQNPALQNPGPGLAVPERSAVDRSWEFSTAHTAGWSRPQVKIGEHDWRPVVAGAQPSTVQTVREEPLVTRGRVLQRAWDGDGLPGFARERTTIGFDVAELHTPAGPVRAYRVRLHINGDGTVDPATQDVINGVKRAAQDGVGQYLNQGYRLPGGEQFHVDVEFVGADQHSHADITVQAGAGRSSQLSWHAGDADPRVLSHEVLHFLGVPDEYADTFTATDGPDELRHALRSLGADPLRGGPGRPGIGRLSNIPDPSRPADDRSLMTGALHRTHAPPLLLPPHPWKIDQATRADATLRTTHT